MYKGNDGRSRIHRQEKFFIVSRCLHSLLHLAHGFNGVHVCDVFAQNPHAIEHMYKGNDGRSRIHRQEKFFIVSRCLHSLLHLAHGFNGVHVCDVFAQNPHAIERLLVLEQIVTTRA